MLHMLIDLFSTTFLKIIWKIIALSAGAINIFNVLPSIKISQQIISIELLLISFSIKKTTYYGLISVDRFNQMRAFILLY